MPTWLAIIIVVLIFGVVILLVINKTKKLTAKKDKNFTCKKCGTKFKWNESKINVRVILNEKPVISGNSTFYHTKYQVTWECECGEKNTFEIRLSSRNEVYGPVEHVYQYYIGKILN